MPFLLMVTDWRVGVRGKFLSSQDANNGNYAVVARVPLLKYVLIASGRASYPGEIVDFTDGRAVGLRRELAEFAGQVPETAVLFELARWGRRGLSSGGRRWQGTQVPGGYSTKVGKSGRAAGRELVGVVSVTDSVSRGGR